MAEKIKTHIIERKEYYLLGEFLQTTNKSKAYSLIQKHKKNTDIIPVCNLPKKDILEITPIPGSHKLVSKDLATKIEKLISGSVNDVIQIDGLDENSALKMVDNILENIQIGREKFKELKQRFYTTEVEITDILHEIELINLTDSKKIYWVNELARLRKERRKLKNILHTLEPFNDLVRKPLFDNVNIECHKSKIAIATALNQVVVSTHYKARVRDDLQCGNKERNNTKNE